MTYECPVCGLQSTVWTRCYRPGCPNGRGGLAAEVEATRYDPPPDEDIYALARDVDRRYRRQEFIQLYLTWLTICVLVLAGVWLTGCSTVPDPGTRIGPYDISLTSHREALGMNP